MNIVIIGPSGSGKGTQADLIEKDFGWRHISSGHLLREEAQKETELGKKIDKLLTEGSWLPSDSVFEVLEPVLKDAINEGFVLDGFPRSFDQVGILENFLKENNTGLDLVIHLKIGPEIILERRKRLWDQGKGFYPGEERSDESETAIKKRFESYFATITPILDYYRGKGILFEVDAERPVKPIFKDILRIINSLPRRQAGKHQ